VKLSLDSDLILGIATWMALAGFCWLLLLCFRDDYSRRNRPRRREVREMPALPEKVEETLKPLVSSRPERRFATTNGRASALGTLAICRRRNDDDALSQTIAIAALDAPQLHDNQSGRDRSERR
jgi:hypothetical protein